jgi:hypothetical protein
MSLNERMSTLFGLPFTHEVIMERLEYAQRRGIVDAEITILAPQMFCEYVEPGRVHFKGKMPSDYPTGSDEFEIVVYHKDGASFSHYCSGNGAGIVIYDPYSATGSASVRDGTLIGKRIFKIL